MKHIFLLFLCLLLFNNIEAQNIVRNLKGRVIDSATSKPLADVTISVFRAKDTMLLNFGFTTPIGNFSLNVQSVDSLLIVVSMYGYDEKNYTDPFMEDNWSFRNFGDVKLTATPYTLTGFTAKTSAIRMKGDTIEISASRFKVLPGSDVAQLFKKIPGFEVTVKGEVKVNGSAVNTIMVDGSDFFGNNPGMVSKNLTADMIETVQVFDERNPDGTPNEEGNKVINLKLKKGKRNGTFGDVLAGYGTENRYESGLRLNQFKNDRKFSLIINSNNINETGFDFGFENWHGTNTIQKNGSTNDGGFYYYNSNSSGEGNINHKTGLGLTYFNEFTKKRKLSINLFTNRNDYNSISSSNSSSALNDSTQRINKDSSSSFGLLYRNSFEVSYTKEIDSTGEYDFGVNGGFSSNTKTTNGFNSILLNDLVLNKGNSNIKNINNSNNLKVSSSLYRTLRKNKEYNFFFASSFQINNDNNLSYQFLENNTDTFNNKNERNVSGSEWLTKLQGTMPVYKKIKFNLSLDRWENRNNTNQISNSASNQYSEQFEQSYVKSIDSLSIRFKNKQIQNSIKSSFSYRSKYLFSHIGATYLNMQLTNSDENGQILLSKSYPKILPFYGLYYYPSKMYLNFTLSKTVSFPTISDLLPVLNLSNNYERRKGNPNLAPSDNYGMRFYTSFYKLKGFKYLSGGINATISDNMKIWVNRQDENGIIVKTPENAKGYMNFHTWTGASKKINKIINAVLFANFDYAKNPLIINEQSAFGHQTDFSINPSFNFSHTDSLEFSFGLEWSNTNFNNSLNSSLDFKQNVFRYYSDARAIFRTGTELNTTLSINDQRNVPGIGKIVPVWSAYIQQSLGKKSPFNLKLTAYDILKQNTNISRYASDNFVTINQSNQLQRYFMLTLVYKIKKVGATEATEYTY